VLFSSYEFLLVFLPAAWFAYVVMGRRSQHAAIGVLLVFSLFFYALWSSVFLLILLGSITFNFTIGIALSNQQKQSQRFQRGLLAFGVTGNLVLLAYFKYVDFFGRNIAALLGMEHATLGIVLPLGISFYTFTQIAFLVDAYRSEVREYRPLHYVLFVTYFPQLIAGPIVHHKEMMPQLSRNKVRAGITAEHLCLGFGFLSIGLFKKLVVADSLAGFATPIFDAALAPSFIEAWIAALAYTFQLYFDFGLQSAYVDEDFKLHRAGGRGFVIDDAGGGFWMAKEALRRIWHERDKNPDSHLDSPLAMAMFATMGGSDWNHTRQFV
jgi:D-alanyl-lipoteichoic acid acyltransferase DltB (MBOAT superfamily)